MQRIFSKSKQNTQIKQNWGNNLEEKQYEKGSRKNRRMYAQKNGEDQRIKPLKKINWVEEFEMKRSEIEKTNEWMTAVFYTWKPIATESGFLKPWSVLPKLRWCHWASGKKENAPLSGVRRKSWDSHTQPSPALLIRMISKTTNLISLFPLVCLTWQYGPLFCTRESVARIAGMMIINLIYYVLSWDIPRGSRIH